MPGTALIVYAVPPFSRAMTTSPSRGDAVRSVVIVVMGNWQFRMTGLRRVVGPKSYRG